MFYAYIPTFSPSSSEFEDCCCFVLLLCSSTPAFEIFFGVLVLVLHIQKRTTRVRSFRWFVSRMAVSAGPVALSEVATLPVQVPLLQLAMASLSVLHPVARTSADISFLAVAQAPFVAVA